MPNTEILVTITGPEEITFNDYSGGTPDYILRNTARLFSPPRPRRAGSPRQGEHGIHDSLSFYEARVLAFEGEIIGSSQSDRKDKENALRQCLSLRGLQSVDAESGYRLVQFTDEDGVEKQLYAKIDDALSFDIPDNIDPSRRTFGFVMVAEDPLIYSQELHSETGGETSHGTNFRVITGVSPKVPFQLYQNTFASLTCTNEGIFDSPPVITITGPTTTPTVTNTTTGEFITLDGLELDDDETVTIDIGQRTIVKNDDTDLSSYFGDGSSWFVLQPGDNDLTLLDATMDMIEATIEVQWRDAWI